MIHRMIPVVVALLSVTAAGCGVSPADSGKVWASVQRSLGALPGNQQALTASVSFDVDCARGGEAALQARLDIDDSLRNAVTALFGWEITYDACQPDENTLDGQLDYDAGVLLAAEDNGGVMSVRTVYTGVVTSSGETNGTCEIDVVGTLEAAAYENPGDEFHGQVDATYTGTICGNDVDEVFSAKADADL